MVKRNRKKSQHAVPRTRLRVHSCHGEIAKEHLNRYEFLVSEVSLVFVKSLNISKFIDFCTLDNVQILLYSLSKCVILLLNLSEIKKQYVLLDKCSN